MQTAIVTHVKKYPHPTIVYGMLNGWRLASSSEDGLHAYMVVHLKRDVLLTALSNIVVNNGLKISRYVGILLLNPGVATDAMGHSTLVYEEAIVNHDYKRLI